MRMALWVLCNKSAIIRQFRMGIKAPPGVCNYTSSRLCMITHLEIVFGGLTIHVGVITVRVSVVAVSYWWHGEKLVFYVWELLKSDHK